MSFLSLVVFQSGFGGGMRSHLLSTSPLRVEGWPPTICFAIEGFPRDLLLGLLAGQFFFQRLGFPTRLLLGLRCRGCAFLGLGLEFGFAVSCPLFDFRDLRVSGMMGAGWVPTDPNLDWTCWRADCCTFSSLVPDMPPGVSVPTQ